MQIIRPTSCLAVAPLAAPTVCAALLGLSFQARAQTTWEYSNGTSGIYVANPGLSGSGDDGGRSTVDGLSLGALLLMAAFGRRRAG